MFHIPIKVIISIFRARLVFAGELGKIGFATFVFFFPPLFIYSILYELREKDG